MSLTIRTTPSAVAKLVSAIELDLKRIAIIYLPIDKEPRVLLGEDLWCRSKLRFLNENKNFTKDPDFEELVLYVDMGDLCKVLNKNIALLPSNLGRYSKEITAKIERIVPIRNKVAHNRPLYFTDCEDVLEVAEYLLATTYIDWHNLKSKIEEIRYEQVGKYERIMNNLPIPDYEETGYIGRKKQVSDLTKLVLESPYPIISILGEGGLGKSALALKIASDIIELPNCAFDAIIWVSAKTQVLTPHEIIKIDNEIKNSLELFNRLSGFFSSNVKKEPIDEVIDFLQQLNLLLILDNLETVLDDNIATLFRNIPRNSKILITSRIGIGAYDYPFKLQQLEESDSIQLLKASANIRQVPNLVAASGKTLAEYCRQMSFNPLFIKWFVEAVQTGLRPEEVLNNKNLLLDFCMSNVYQYLSPNSKKILSVMLCINSRLTQAELYYYSNIEFIEFEDALRQLKRTSMIVMNSKAGEKSYDSTYFVADLARDYLLKNHPLESQFEKDLRKSQRQLTAEMERLNSENGINPYKQTSISINSRGELVVAKYLGQVLSALRAFNSAEVERLLSIAHNLAPHYFEVYRVEALCFVESGNMTQAFAAYENALEKKPDSAPLRMWFGGFLLIYEHEARLALEQFKEAAKCDPQSVWVKANIARAAMYIHQYDEARQTLDEILSRIHELYLKFRKRVFDFNLQYYVRKAEYMLDHGEREEAISLIEQFKVAYLTVPNDCLDEHTQKQLERALYVPRSLMSCNDVNMRNRSEQVLAWLKLVTQNPIIE